MADKASRKKAGVLLLLLGVIVLVVSLIADTVGIGGWPGIGTAQIAGAVGGALVGVVGLLLARG